MPSSIRCFSGDGLCEPDQILCGMQSTAGALRIVGRQRFAVGGSAPGRETHVFLRVLDHSKYHMVSAFLARGTCKDLRLSGENLRGWDARGWLCLGECGMLLAARNAHKGFDVVPDRCLRHSCISCWLCFVNWNQLSKAFLA